MARRGHHDPVSKRPPTGWRGAPRDDGGVTALAVLPFCWKDVRLGEISEDEGDRSTLLRQVFLFCVLNMFFVDIDTGIFCDVVFEVRY